MAADCRGMDGPSAVSKDKKGKRNEGNKGQKTFISAGGLANSDPRELKEEKVEEDGFFCSQFGRICRVLGMNHRIAPTPQAKGKIERSMRTFQHRIVVVLKAEGVDNEVRANVVGPDVGALPEQSR